ncbi:MAG: hypothetical protein ACR2KO_04950 [Geodermatophilaceae bacterium]
MTVREIAVVISRSLRRGCHHVMNALFDFVPPTDDLTERVVERHEARLPTCADARRRLRPRAVDMSATLVVGVPGSLVGD